MVSTKTINRACAVIAVVYLLTVVPWSLRRWSMGGGDFSQFYMGGAVAAAGSWDALYPEPKPDSLNNPGMPDDSTPRAGFVAISQAKAVDATQAKRFIQPPPAALLFLPLGFLKFWTAYRLWIWAACATAAGLCILAGRTFSIAIGRETPISGLITVAVAISPLLFHSLRQSNVCSFVAMTVAISTWCLWGTFGLLGAAAVVVGGALKYATLSLLPLMVAMRRWRAIAWTGLASLVFLGVSFGIEGKQPFVDYVSVVAPRLSRVHTISANQSVAGVALRMRYGAGLEDIRGPYAVMLKTAERGGGYPVWWNGIRLARLATIIVLLVLIFTRKLHTWRAPTNVIAAATALVGWLLIFSPTFWPSYVLYLVPSFGWLCAVAKRPGWARILPIAGLALTMVPLPLFDSIDVPEPINSHVLFGTICIFATAVVELMRANDGESLVLSRSERTPTEARLQPIV